MTNPTKVEFFPFQLEVMYTKVFCPRVLLGSGWGKHLEDYPSYIGSGDRITTMYKPWSSAISE